jgi:hypothetical protein
MTGKTFPGRIAAIILIVALGIVFLWYTIKPFLGEHGSAGDVAALEKVYRKAGPLIATTFTNSLIQKFPFDGPVNWKLIFFKDTHVILLGKVDTNRLHQFISDNPSTQFVWDGIDTNGENYGEVGWPEAKIFPTTTWTNLFFRSPNFGEPAGKYSPILEGQVAFPSREVIIQSY